MSDTAAFHVLWVATLTITRSMEDEDSGWEVVADDFIDRRRPVNRTNTLCDLNCQMKRVRKTLEKKPRPLSGADLMKAYARQHFKNCRPGEWSSAGNDKFCQEKGGRCPQQMTLDTQMTLALLQELLMALRANDPDGYKGWLALGIEKLGRDVAGEVESYWMVPLLVEEERDRLMAWSLGVSL